jgi:membrane fusion protein, multidrug efflux system
MKTIFRAAVAVGMLLVGGCQKGNMDAPPTQVRAYPTMVVAKRHAELRSTYPATLSGKEEVEIKPQLEGYIEAVYIKEGQRVHRGQPLFKINSPSTVNALQQARAQVATAALDVERIRPLAEKGVVSKVSLESYENTLASAKASLQQAQASMAWVSVSSPTDGLVGTIDLRIGSLVNTTSTLTTISNTSSVVARFAIGEKELSRFLGEWKGRDKEEKIRNIPSVGLVLSDGSVYPDSGRIETISGKIEEATGTASVRAIFPNRNGLLLSGAGARLVMHEFIDSAIVVPCKSTFSIQDRTLLYVVRSDSAHQRSVVARALPDGKDCVIESGLVVGERVVVDGLVNLSEGQKILVK